MAVPSYPWFHITGSTPLAYGSRDSCRAGYLEKKLKITILILGVLHPDKDIEAWFQDEARIGLQPTIKRRWSLKGKRFLAPSNKKYKWLYAYAFVHPTDGDNFWLLLPTVNVKIMSLALKEFVKDRDPNEEKIIVLVIDQAGFHSLKSIDVPDNIIIRFLPSHTPELQPVESLWPLLKEATHNKQWDSIEQLEKKLIKRCQYLLEHPETVKGRTGFSWACCTLKTKSFS